MAAPGGPRTRHAGRVNSYPPDPPAPEIPAALDPHQPPSAVQDLIVGDGDPPAAGKVPGSSPSLLAAWWERRKQAWRKGESTRRHCSDGCDVACCACEDISCCFDTNLFVGLLSVLWFAAVHRPRDPHTTAPDSPAARAAWALVRSYQLVVSARRARPVCPMTPSCSRYALQALSAHGLCRGGWLTARRLRRCSRRHPAYDPVPAPRTPRHTPRVRRTPRVTARARP